MRPALSSEIYKTPLVIFISSEHILAAWIFLEPSTIFTSGLYFASQSASIHILTVIFSPTKCMKIKCLIHAKFIISFDELSYNVR